MTTFERRARRAQSRLDTVGADCLVLSPGRDCYYLTGVDAEQSDRLQLCFLPVDGDPTFVVPRLEAESIRAATWVDDVRTWDDDTGPDPVLDPLLDDLSPSRILLADRMWTEFALALQRRLPDASVGLASEVLGPLRRRKDDRELDALRAAADAADATMNEVRALEADAVGMTEAELAAFIEDRLAAHGGDGVAFETIVASGSNGADPHHASGEREIRAGDPVVLDFGTRVEGYVSDQTRTIVFDGEPSEEFERVHDVVREAQSAGVAAVEPGVTTGAVDRAVREIIEDAGYGDRFVHRTGHGVGLDVHEAPNVAADGETELEPGMVFSVEPGVYLPDRFGVRVEDLVVVTGDGAERLNHTDRRWRC
ncbi:M24 family metallopeptidase [Haloplanus aerogenes]|uniref:Aminopeptidase P family protein n=1 Tax=Haloplanus aerogenes TaxID=660522 RepID=A0A3M0DTA4_9EURY|nr:Xaa-Pro peptidase family protein [Haloplanus aerogenes]AZH25512.1 aminopeptidase P family protein [Haloplanus aerogenes]RMB25225.1 Xaa-Pro aminopeptidase [Haloplanus aerogenes]